MVCGGVCSVAMPCKGEQVTKKKKSVNKKVQNATFPYSFQKF
jgi:hypothetical protein